LIANLRAERRDELLQGDGRALTETLTRANRIYHNVRQTNDATLDSRLLVNVADVAHKKSAQLVLGDSSTGIDVDEFLSKCITFMRHGGPVNSQKDGVPSSTARRRRTRDGDDEDEDAGAALDWEAFGRLACFPTISRPPVPGFLLGPLSVEKKIRTHTRRRAKQTKDSNHEARPEALTKEDMQQSDENGLTAVCARIRRRLQDHITAAEETLRTAGFSAEELETEKGRDMLKKCRLASNGQVSLFDFTLNPHSFGQSVENLFYVSFLIKEGAVGLDEDENGFPTLRKSYTTPKVESTC
jgi:non-structural maintenance of chromosomes element 4